MSKSNVETVAEGLALAAIPDERKAGFTFPGISGAIATAYFEKYGASREDLMNITIKSHGNAPLNPKAQYQATIRDIMRSKIKRAKEKGGAVPDWSDEKDFLRDPVANPPIAWAHAPFRLLSNQRWRSVHLIGRGGDCQALH